MKYIILFLILIIVIAIFKIYSVYAERIINPEQNVEVKPIQNISIIGYMKSFLNKLFNSNKETFTNLETKQAPKSVAKTEELIFLDRQNVQCDQKGLNEMELLWSNEHVDGGWGKWNYNYACAQSGDSDGLTLESKRTNGNAITQKVVGLSSGYDPDCTSEGGVITQVRVRSGAYDYTCGVPKHGLDNSSKHTEYTNYRPISYENIAQTIATYPADSWGTTALKIGENCLDDEAIQSFNYQINDNKGRYQYTCIKEDMAAYQLFTQKTNIKTNLNTAITAENEQNLIKYLKEADTVSLSSDSIFVDVYDQANQTLQGIYVQKALGALTIAMKGKNTGDITTKINEAETLQSNNTELKTLIGDARNRITTLKKEASDAVADAERIQTLKSLITTLEGNIADAIQITAINTVDELKDLHSQVRAANVDADAENEVAAGSITKIDPTALVAKIKQLKDDEIKAVQADAINKITSGDGGAIKNAINTQITEAEKELELAKKDPTKTSEDIKKIETKIATMREQVTRISSTFNRETDTEKKDTAVSTVKEVGPIQVELVDAITKMMAMVMKRKKHKKTSGANIKHTHRKDGNDGGNNSQNNSGNTGGNNSCSSRNNENNGNNSCDNNTQTINQDKFTKNIDTLLNKQRSMLKHLSEHSMRHFEDKNKKIRRKRTTDDKYILKSSIASCAPPINMSEYVLKSSIHAK